MLIPSEATSNTVPPRPKSANCRLSAPLEKWLWVRVWTPRPTLRRNKGHRIIAPQPLPPLHPSFLDSLASYAEFIGFPLSSCFCNGFPTAAVLPFDSIPFSPSRPHCKSELGSRRSPKRAIDMG